MKLTSENVHNVFMDSLFNDDEFPAENPVIGKGVMLHMGFHPERLKNNEQAVVEMLSELPDSFKKTGGGGMSFLNMNTNKDGEEWTSLHQTIDELVCLGVALGKISFPMSRDMWMILPGGVPYIVIN